MPQEVIHRVDQLGKAEGWPEMLTFSDREGHLIGGSETPGVPDTLDATIPGNMLNSLIDVNQQYQNFHTLHLSRRP